MLLSAITHLFNVRPVLLMSAVFLSFFAGPTHAQNYSDNLQDIINLDTFRPAAVGNLGNLDVVVDLRGFIPLSLSSRTEMLHPVPLGDVLHWYKIPTKKALLMFYFGDLASAHIADDTTALEATRFGKTRFLKESEAVGSETAVWCKFAYQVARDSGPVLFEKIAGDGLEVAEPTTVILNNQSVFVILSFRYHSFLHNRGTGQILVALEFSRSSKRYKTYYQLYSNMLVNKPTADAFKETAPIVAKALIEAGII